MPVTNHIYKSKWITVNKLETTHHAVLKRFFWTLAFDWDFMSYLGLPVGTVVKNLPAHAGKTKTRSLSREDPLKKRNSNPILHLCRGNPTDRGACGLPSVELQSRTRTVRTHTLHTGSCPIPGEIFCWHYCFWSEKWINSSTISGVPEKHADYQA